MKKTRWGIMLAAAAVPLALAGPAATAATAPEPAAQAAQAAQTDQQAFTAIEDRYWNDADLRQLLGDPVDSEQNTEKFNYQQYQHGWMFQNLGDGEVTAIQGDIAARYTDLGGAPDLGAATTDELGAPDGVGRYNHFVGGTIYPSIYWTPDTGAQAVWGPVRDFWESKGWEVGYLGYPTKTTTATADEAGSYNHFVGPDGAGASVYWSEGTGAHSVQGDIRDIWAAQGWETGELGYPTTDEQVTADEVGRSNEFTGGAAYWHPDSGAHWLTGPILTHWDELGRETSHLGYPTSEPYEVDGGQRVDFQGGYAVLTAETGVVEDFPW